MKPNASAKLKWHTADMLSERGLPSWMRRWLVLLQTQLALMKSDFSYSLGFAWTSSFLPDRFWKIDCCVTLASLARHPFPTATAPYYLVHPLVVMPFVQVWVTPSDAQSYYLLWGGTHGTFWFCECLFHLQALALVFWVWDRRFSHMYRASGMAGRIMHSTLLLVF
jgi:hypothetical protein